MQRIYGLPLIEGWREKIWKPFQKETGITVCYVWQSVDGEEVWQRMLHDPDMHYYGVTGNASFPLEIRAKLVREAYEQRKRVHGFAAVRTSWLKKIPFYSVDSTSWAAGSYWGNVPTFDARTGHVKQLGAGRSAFKENPKKAAAALAMTGGRVKIKDLVNRGQEQNFNALLNQATEAYARFERWFTAYWRTKGVDWDARLSGSGP